MADVVWLKASERPPEDRSFALVAADRSAAGPVSDAPVAQGRGMVFYIPQTASEAERSEAIARACTWAQRNDLDVVYVETH
jgi:hypothetical protein